MATNDSNGIVFYGPGDPVEPIQGAFNGLAASISNKFSTETQVRRVATVPERTTAVAQRASAGRPITAADPIIVWRSNAAAGSQLESSTNGTDWRSHFSGNDTGWLTGVGGAGWGGTPQFRLYNNVVYGRGYFVRVGSAVNIEFGGPQMGTLPAAIPNPPQEMEFTGVNGVDSKIGVRVLASGAIILRAHYGQAPSWPTNQYMSLSNISYPVG